MQTLAVHSAGVVCAFGGGMLFVQREFATSCIALVFAALLHAIATGGLAGGE